MLRTHTPIEYNKTSISWFAVNLSAPFLQLIKTKSIISNNSARSMSENSPGFISSRFDLTKIVEKQKSLTFGYLQ
jgi:hypothetical protein